MTGPTLDLDEESDPMKIKALMAFIIGGALALVTLSWTGVIPMASAQEEAEEEAEGEEAAEAEEAKRAKKAKKSRRVKRAKRAKKAKRNPRPNSWLRK